MSEPTSSTSPLLRFFDSFLHEKNIKWLLCSGAAILLCSSAMLVTSHWDTIDNVWRFLILTGYIGLIHFAGQWAFHRMSLRQTGNGLMALTVMLLPLTFITWHLFVLGNWLQANSMAPVLAVGLLILNLIFSCFAADRIFRHFLHGRQTTFTVCYLLLCVSGAIAPSLVTMGTTISVVASLVMWSLFLVGSIKVNRHVFWLVESHQRPRVYGFLPVMLLGAQFVGLFAANFMFRLPIDWLGLACVLFSIPVLLTADAVARVFQQRTGELIKTLPWAIATPMVSGIFCCVAGILLAAIPLANGERPYVLVPVAALSAGILALVAIRTKHQVFAYLSIICVVLTYNFSPIFFATLARQLVDAGAAAVNASRLPYAFYGLTYLPLLVAFTFMTAQIGKRGWSLFHAPLKNVSMAMPLILLVASFSEPSLGLYPVFLVGSAMTCLFAVQTWVYRERLVAIGTVVSFLLTAASTGAFANQVFNTNFSVSACLMIFSGAAAVLSLYGRFLDHRLNLLLNDVSLEANDATNLPIFLRAICQSGGLCASVGGAAVWLAFSVVGVTSVEYYSAAAIIVVSLFVNCLRFATVPLSALFYAFCAAIFGVLAADIGISLHQSIFIGTGLWLGQWILDYVFDSFPDARVTKAFRTVNRYSATIGLWMLFVIYYLPVAFRALVPDLGLPNLCGIALLVWMFDAARKWQMSFMSYVGYGYGLLWATALTLSLLDLPTATEWLPVVWAMIPLLTLPAIYFLQRHREKMEASVSLAINYHACLAILNPLVVVGQIVLIGSGSVALLGLTWPCRIAGVLATTGLWAFGSLRRTEWNKSVSSVMLNWHVIAGLLTATASIDSWLDVTSIESGWVIAASSFMMAVSLLLWKFSPTTCALQPGWIRHAHIRALQIYASAGLLLVFVGGDGGALEVVLALATYAVFGLLSVWSALSSQRESNAWASIGILWIAVAYAASALGIPLHHFVGLFGLLAIGFVCTAISDRVASHPNYRVYARPMRSLSLALPIFVVALATMRHITVQDVTSVEFSLNSLAMLVAAGFYFGKGMEAKQGETPHRVSYFSIAAVIANLAFIFVGLKLQVTVPDFYLIPIGATVLLLTECLRRDVPKNAANGMRYVGAILILVSPTFSIIGGGWAPMLTLMITSVLLILVSMGVRAKALLYVGTGFLAADLAAMVVRGCWDQPNLLWVAGVVVGVSVLSLAALAENSREKLLQHMRVVSAHLQEWS